MILSLRVVAFAAMLFYGQVEYLLGWVGYFVAAAGIFLAVLSFLLRRGVVIPIAERGIFLVFLLIFLLSIVLYVYGSAGQSSPRLLYFHSLMQLLMVMIVLDASVDRDIMARLVDVLFLYVTFEFLLMLAQYSHVAFGVGLAPRENQSFDGSVISGSFGNPNNASVAVGGIIFFLSYVYHLQRNYARLLIVLIGGGISIFLTLSRSVLVFYFIIGLYYALYYYNPLRVISSSKKFLGSVLLLSIAILFYPFYLDFFLSQARSIERLSSVFVLASDQSSQFRWIVHQRLWENIGSLGFGVVSDLNYSRYFKAGDDPLMMVSPHSFLAEYSFLYGFVGLLVSMSLLILLVFKVLRRLTVSYWVRIPFAIYIVVAQMVPSSVLAFSLFFIPFVFFVAIDFDGVAKDAAFEERL